MYTWQIILRDIIFVYKNLKLLLKQVWSFIMARSKEVAQYTVISRATVSRTLNGTAHVSAETSARIQLVASQSTGSVPKEVS